MINEKQFTELYTDITKKATKIPQQNYLGEGNYPIVDQGKGQIAGRWNEVEGLCIEIPAIIFGDHTRVIKYIDEPFFIGADGVKVLRPTNKADNPKYYYYALQAARIPNLGYSRHFKVVKELMIRVYPRADQDKIVSILEKIDEVIEIRQAELSALEQLVKSRFIEVFGDPVSNDKGWPHQAMDKVAPSSACSGDSSERVWLLNLDMVEAQTGRIIDYLYVDKAEVGTSTCCFDEGNVLYSKLRPYLNKVVVPTKKGYCTTELVPLRPNVKLNRQFLAFLLRSDSFVSFINEKVAGAKMPRVSMNVFREFECILPPIDLQNEFATFVEQVDKSKYHGETTCEMEVAA